jgi:hypothetical protein
MKLDKRKQKELLSVLEYKEIDWKSKETLFQSVVEPYLSLTNVSWLDDDMFMAECRRRTNDTAKCELCELRFKCFTSKEPDFKVTSSGYYDPKLFGKDMMFSKN